MTLITRPSLTDSPDGISGGTAVDEALFTAILDAVDDLLHSLTYPTVSPADLIDEVVEARGDLASLKDRLDAISNADGTPVSDPDLTTLIAEVETARDGNASLDDRFAILDALLAGAEGSEATIAARLANALAATGYLVDPYTKTISHTAGTGTHTGRAPIVFDSIVTPVGNTLAAETDLWSKVVPGNTLDTNGRFIKVKAAGTLAANANTKILRFKFGSTSIDLNTASAFGSAAAKWSIEAVIVRRSATTQYIICEFKHDQNPSTYIVGPTQSAASETLSGNVTAKLTGQSSVATNDIVLQALVAEVY